MRKKRLTDGYSFRGFRPYQVVSGIDDDPCARIVRLKRIQKKRNVLNAGNLTAAITIRKPNSLGIYRAETCVCTLKLQCDGVDAG